MELQFMNFCYNGLSLIRTKTAGFDSPFQREFNVLDQMGYHFEQSQSRLDDKMLFIRYFLQY